MLSTTLISSAIFFGSALAATSTVTPPGFTPASSTLLGVFYGTNTTTVASAAHISPAQVASSPQLALSTKSDVSKYVTLLVDIDLFYNNKSQILLHWLAQDLAVDANSTYGSFPYALTNTSYNLAGYVSPSPPAGETHRYVFLTFAQPEGFGVDVDYNTNVPQSRLDFDLQGFIEKKALGTPVAANYFIATGAAAVSSSNASTTAAATTSAIVTYAATSTSSSTSTSTPVLVNGAAVRGVSWIWLAAAGSFALALF